jgi:hypothetical protein
MPVAPSLKKKREGEEGVGMTHVRSMSIVTCRPPPPFPTAYHDFIGVAAN